MYKCENCNRIFEEEELIEETVYDTVEYWGQNVSMPYSFYKCPECGSEDIEEFYGEVEE